VQVRDKIIKEVAEKMGLTQATVRKVITAQAKLIKSTMKEKKEVSVYLRKVGLYQNSIVGKQLKKEKYQRRAERLKNITTTEPEKDPFEFD
jgi:predicted transcriptional regulator